LAVVLVGASALVSSLAFARTPVPFTDAYHDGIHLVLWGKDYTDEELDRYLDQIRDEGARQVTLPLFGCQTDIHSSDVSNCEGERSVYGTPSDSRVRLIHLARLAQAKGLAATFLPIVRTKSWDWRGYFDPTDVDGWFRTYTAWIRGVARDAQSLGMKELVVGTELSLLYKHADAWRKVLDAVREDFHGPLILTVNWGDFDFPFWDAADAIGVSAYFPLSTADDPSQDVLDAAWIKIRDQMLAVSRQWSRPLHVTEVGYESTTHAAATPWDSGPDARPDAELQARCFRAFSRAWVGQPELVRASIWAEGDTPADSFAMSFDFIGKAAGAVVSEFFAARAKQ
jgi:hypothetical protein